MSVPSPSYNAALYPKCIVSIEGLLRLVALVAQYRATLDWNTQGGAACQSDPSPPPQEPVVPHLWGQLPSSQQQRLVAVLSQMMMAHNK